MPVSHVCCLQALRNGLLVRLHGPQAMSLACLQGSLAEKYRCLQAHPLLFASHYRYGWRTYFAADKAEISTGSASRLCAFRGVMCEATFRRFRVRQPYPKVTRESRGDRSNEAYR